VIVLGVGNRLRGDDAVGCVLCDELSGKVEAEVIDSGDTPENYVEPVAKLRPRRILVIDCCDFGASAGEFRLFSRQELEELSYGLLSTHTLPLSLTVELLALETGATIELLGIQPERIEFGTDLSPSVQAALPALVERVRAWVSA
jgi:hydrogenase maturation protease